MHCTKISAEFEFRGHTHSPLGAHPQKCGVGLGMRQVLWFGDRSTGMGTFGGKFGHAIVFRFVGLSVHNAHAMGQNSVAGHYRFR